MITNRETTSTNKLRLIIAATLVFAFYCSYSQTNKTKVNTEAKINLEKTSAAKPVQDYNSSRSNRPTPIAWLDSITVNDTVPRSAQDYNSSRSNKPRPIFDTAEKDTVQRPAQDYNSSRSNRPTPIAWINDTIGSDTVPRLVKDYNASRKDYDAKNPKEPRSITPQKAGTRNDSVPILKQDYNSSGGK